MNGCFAVGTVAWLLIASPSKSRCPRDVPVFDIQRSQRDKNVAVTTGSPKRRSKSVNPREVIKLT